jgi:hypothetical protein
MIGAGVVESGQEQPRMAKKVAPLKRRTREHVLEDLSINHVEGVILHEGHTVQRIDDDYGYDLFVTTFDAKGFPEQGVVFLQVKAAEKHQIVKTDFVFDLDVRDYNLWIREEMPVILILFDAAREQAVWLPVQRYFRSDVSRRPRKGAKTVRVRIPVKQAWDGAAVATIRELKREVLDE